MGFFSFDKSNYEALRSICDKTEQAAIEYDKLEEWIKDKLDKENLSPGKYYPPDEKTYEQYKKSN